MDQPQLYAEMEQTDQGISGVSLTAAACGDLCGAPVFTGAGGLFGSIADAICMDNTALDYSRINGYNICVGRSHLCLE